MRHICLPVLFAVTAFSQTIPVLSQSEIQQLEAKVAQDPYDIKSQAVLGQNYAMVILGVTGLGQYNTVATTDLALANSDFAAHARNAIENSTLPTVLGEGGKALWSFSFDVQARNRQIPYLVGRALGAQALDRAIVIDPGNTTWRYYRIPIAVLRSTDQNLPLNIEDAYSEVKDDLSHLTGMTRDAVLAYGAKLAVNAGQLDDAQAYATELLNTAGNPSGWNYGNDIFFGNMVLGQVALRRGDLETAKSRLLASGKTPGSPQLDSFGPNMSLARDLLTGVPQAEAGAAAPPSPASPRRHAVSPDAQQTVLAFFDLCAAFWKMDYGHLAQWGQQVRAGTVPDFGSNLLY